ncbi:hypothetical protein BaRGS_00014037 [Batillaria attramentaria]|uniref:Uncharacterized protein n=1 Tax=Batillaria attramentaria TaxID=370345 RepID=A0ABD0L4Y3_9CAEN
MSIIKSHHLLISNLHGPWARHLIKLLACTGTGTLADNCPAIRRTGDMSKEKACQALARIIDLKQSFGASIEITNYPFKPLSAADNGD